MWCNTFHVEAQDTEEGALISRGSLFHCIVLLLRDSHAIITFGSLDWDRCKHRIRPSTYRNHPTSSCQHENSLCRSFYWCDSLMTECVSDKKKKDIFSSEFAQEKTAPLTPANGIQLDISKWIHNNNWIQASLISVLLCVWECINKNDQSRQSYDGRKKEKKS